MTTLDQSYARCRELTKGYGRASYAATFLLPRVKRHHIHALYGFCRYAGDVVDQLEQAPIEAREKALADLGERFSADVDRGDSDDEVLKAVVHTVVAFDINPDCFRRFLRAKATDLTISEFETFDDLLDFMDGSAAIGEMMLPILEPTSAEAFTHARDLGIAFELTTILRDVSKELERGRIYLPREDLQKFGADPALRQTNPEWRALMAFEVRRAREYYASAEAGIALLPPASARYVRAIRRMYSEVLDHIEAAGGDVFSGRARVRAARKAVVLGRSALSR